MIDHAPHPPRCRGRFHRRLDLAAEETADAVEQARGGSPKTVAQGIIAPQGLRFPYPQR